MKSLVVDDDFFSRRVLQNLLAGYGECHAAADGKEAMLAFEQSFEEREEAYDLICLDIMMPGMNGQEVLKNIRKYEKEKSIYGRDCVKIVMTSTLSDSDNIKEAFREQCESYLIKPVDKEKLTKILSEFKLI